MQFNLEESLNLLSRTPMTLRALIEGLPDTWVHSNEGPETWSPFDVVGHLVHGELTDWVPRAEVILRDGEGRPFEPFDRVAQFEISKGKSIGDLLDEFNRLRLRSLAAIRERVTEADLDKTGTHPELGRVTMRQLLATWVAHDMAHISQIVRTLAKQYADEVGPWSVYLTILGARTA